MDYLSPIFEDCIFCLKEMVPLRGEVDTQNDVLPSNQF
jgi:hypothetical protein